MLNRFGKGVMTDLKSRPFCHVSRLPLDAYGADRSPCPATVLKKEAGVIVTPAFLVMAVKRGDPAEDRRACS